MSNNGISVSSPPPDTRAEVQRVLRRMHIRNSNAPIKGPGETGAFPQSFLQNVPPVVLDANVLRNDVGYACEHDQRTVLVNAGNVRLLRLFCADHVVAEVAEHGERWAAERGLAPEQFMERWKREYCPLIRAVPIGRGAIRLLNTDERYRLARLEEEDRDDVPSATLAMLLGAFYLTGDARASRAAYGVDFDPVAHGAWVNVLKAGGDAGQLSMMFQTTMQLMLLLGAGLLEGVRWISRSPLLVASAPLIALALTVTGRWPRGSGARVRRSLASAASVASQLLEEYQVTLERIRSAAVPEAQWVRLAGTTDARAVLTRACLYRLARSSQSDRSAVELASLLPTLPVPQGSQKVRAILVSEPYFSQPWRGRWQVGRALTVGSPS